MIKKVFISITFLIVASTFAFANDEMCTDMSELAASIMKARQQGASMSLVISAATKNLDDATSAAIREIVIDAYNAKRWHSESIQKRAIDDYRNKIFLLCINSFDRNE